jgi:hypothetical protein
MEFGGDYHAIDGLRNHGADNFVCNPKCAESLTPGAAFSDRDTHTVFAFLLPSFWTPVTLGCRY